jgi:hypothetical protein
MHQKRGGVDYQISVRSANLDEFNDYLTPPAEIVLRARQLVGH